MRINIYLDDLRECPEGFILVKNVSSAIELLKGHKVGILSLDHDLGVDEKGELLETGYDLVKHICQSNYDIEEIRFHTANPVGRENMYRTLLGAQSRGFISSSTRIRK